MDDEPSAMDDASDGFGRLQSVENASDLAQPILSVWFQGGWQGVDSNGYQGVGHDTSHEH